MWANDDIIITKIVTDYIWFGKLEGHFWNVQPLLIILYEFFRNKFAKAKRFWKKMSCETMFDVHKNMTGQMLLGLKARFG